MSTSLIFTKVSLDDLLVESDAQRPTDEKRAQDIADKWNPNMVGIIKVAMDPVTGDLYIMDGGHRVAAARLVGITELDAEVHYGLDKKARADLFLKLQRNRKDVRIHEQYLVGLTAGYEREVKIQEVLDSMGLKVGGSNSANTIKTVRVMEQIYDVGGANLLRSTLNHCKVAFSSFPTKMWSASLMGGISLILSKFHGDPNFQPKRFIATLRKHDPQGWDQIAGAVSYGRAGSMTRGQFMAEAMIAEYNKGLRKESSKLKLTAD